MFIHLRAVRATSGSAALRYAASGLLWADRFTTLAGLAEACCYNTQAELAYGVPAAMQVVAAGHAIALR